MKKYSAWLKAAAIFQLINAGLHSISLFVSLPATNDTEKQLSNLLDTYKFDMGAGFHRTLGEMTLVFSACLSLVCLLGGLLNWYLLNKRVDAEVMKGVITINLLVFGILFGLTLAFTFLPPMILIGLIVMSLIMARVTVNRNG